MGHPVTSLCPASIRWETRFTDLHVTVTLTWPDTVRQPSTLLFFCLSPGLSWKLGLSGYNKSLIIRIMEGRNGWAPSSAATDVVAPSGPANWLREIIKCWHRTVGERTGNIMNDSFTLKLSWRILQLWIIMSCILTEETLLYYKLCWYVIVGHTLSSLT